MTPLLLPLHGIGGRQDLPIPFGLAVGGAGVAIALSFVILGLAWRNPKYRGNAAGKPLPAAITRTVDSLGFRWFVRIVGLATFLYAMVSLLFGVDRLTNPIFGFIYILVWVGLVPISLVLGPVWRTLNPLRTLHLLLSKAMRQPPSKGLFELPSWLGLWPARARHLRLHLARAGRARPRHAACSARLAGSVRRDHHVRRDPVRRSMVLNR
ncbi:hypothetical protein [Kribbella qitaiheensis]|uniref:hypothetical protein n=1 Tax=Kribbella qitaiheensis TaxID=1544730 RepID=UPI001FEC074C|nr:hypothetical protein [Kribbella qitaiheensis]